MATTNAHDRLRRAARRVGEELRDAAANVRRTSARHQIDVWRHGFYARQARLFDFESHGFDAFLSELHRRRELNGLNANTSLLGDKLNFFLFMGSVGAPTPHVYGFGHGGDVHLFDGADRDAGLEALLERVGRLAVKPRDGSCGDGFALLEHRDGRPHVNGVAVEALAPALRGGFVISDFIEAHPYSSAIYPHSINTIRLINLRDPATGEAFVAFAGHRFGTDRSRPVDNASKGGLTAGIDLETGALSELAALPASEWSHGADLGWYDAHPETGTLVRGTRVPHWEQIVEGANRAMDAMLGLHCIGWDLAVTPDGFTFLEGNDRPAVEYQVHGPLLTDDRTRRFFEAHGMRRRSRPPAGGDLVALPVRAGEQPDASPGGTSLAA